jgi:RNA polymerase sigma factor (sigma-70 family)
MGRSSLAPIVHLLKAHMERSESAIHSDENLLERFALYRDERAFEALLDRHGPMVWGVCRRVLKRVHDVEDAFQATFLVLVRKAKSIRRRPSASSWLHSVAYRIALEARAHSERDLTQERKELMRTGADASTGASFHEVQAILDEEITSLPERLRAPLLLCCLGGRTKAQAARELGWKEGTVASRLARARERLEGRLTRRGVALAAGSTALVMAQKSTAAVPARVVAATVRMARVIAAGEAASVGGVSASASLLAKGAIRGMTMTKLKAFALILSVCVVGTGAGWAANQTWEKVPPPLKANEESSDPGQNADAPKADETPAAKKDFFGDPLPPGILAQMGNAQLRHAYADMHFSEDGKTLISAGGDGMVRQWDMETKKQLKKTVLEKIDRSVGWNVCCSSALSGDGKTAVAQSINKLQVFDATTGKELWSVGDEKMWFWSPAVSYDGKLVAARCSDSNSALSPDGKPMCPLHLFDGRTGKERHVLPYTSENHGTSAFSPDGKLIGVAGAKDIRLWNTETGKEQLKIDAAARAIAFSPDGKLFVTSILSTAARPSKDAVVWDTKTGTKQATLTSSKADNVGAGIVAFSPDGKVLAIGVNNAITLWDMKKYTEIRQIEQMGVSGFTFSPDGKKLASSGMGAMRLWDVGSGKALHEQGHVGEVAQVAVSPDGKVIASLGVCDALRLWDAATGKPLHALGRLNPNWSVKGCAFSPDGKFAIGTSNDNAVHFWEVSTGKPAREYLFNPVGEKEEVADIRDLRISMDGKRLTAVGFEPGLVPKLVAWDMETGKSICSRSINGAFNYVLSPDGTTVALWNIQELRIEDALVDKSRTSVKGDFGGLNCNHYSPDGKFLAVTTLKPEKESDRQPNVPWEKRVDGIRFFRVEDGKESFQIKTPPFDHFAFSRDGKTLATVHDDALRLWEVATGKELFKVKRPESYHCVQDTLITCIDFMPNGKALVTGMGDGTVLVWDLAPAGWSAKTDPKYLDDKALASLWSDLAEENSKAYEPMWILSESPKQALPFLKEQIKPSQGIDPKHVQRLLAELNNSEFETREKAAKELANMRHEIEPALRKALEGNAAEETRRRVQEILDLDPSKVIETGEKLRTLRAIQVLERIGTKEAAEILRKIAGGAASARETQEAKEALERLERRAM